MAKKETSPQTTTPPPPVSLADRINGVMASAGLPIGFGGDRLDAFRLGVDMTMRVVRDLEKVGLTPPPPANP